MKVNRWAGKIRGIVIVSAFVVLVSKTFTTTTTTSFDFCYC